VSRLGLVLFMLAAFAGRAGAGVLTSATWIEYVRGVLLAGAAAAFALCVRRQDRSPLRQRPGA
jgi:hypothetical protein